jgi:hypothetical protein
MKKILFVMADYPDWRQDFFNTWMSPRNKEYAKIHGFEYAEMLKLPKEQEGRYFRNNPTWLKFKVVNDWIEQGLVVDGDIVSHIDADICVVDTSKPFQTSKSFGYAIDSCNTHCMGAYTITINEWSRKLMKNILDAARFERLKNMPHWQTFREQACWYTMCGIQPHSWIPFTELPNYGFHELQNDEVVYSLDELQNHVEIFPTEWNVTHVAGEGFNDYFMIPTNRKKTIFRHFAGGQRWQKEYFTGNTRPVWLSPAHLGTKEQAKEQF